VPSPIWRATLNHIGRIAMRQTWLLAVVVGIATGWARGQTSEPVDDAAKIYSQAAKILRDDDAKNIMSPSSSNEVFTPYPSISDAWITSEKQDYDLHPQVREMVHSAAGLAHATWPARDRTNTDRQQVSFLNECRNLANEIADAAEYQALILKDQPAGFESAADLLHLAELLRNQPGETLVRLLVAEGIETLDINRLMIMASAATITEKVDDKGGLPLATAKDWIARLLNHPNAKAELDQAMANEPAGSATNPILKPSMDRILETIRRVQTERDMAAISLAAHVYQYKHGAWPASLEELETELPSVPLDPWGDGKQTLGYVLIKGGLPDNTDRPLVYSRCRSADGLFFRTDEAEYRSYNSYGSKLLPGKQKDGGQFRDVARWPAGGEKKEGATTQALP